MLDEILELLDPGDIVTHCFNGKPGGNILDDEHIYALAERCAAAGVVLDVGHGAASYSFKVAEVAIERGLLPQTISTDLHICAARSSGLGPGDHHGQAAGRRHAVRGGGRGGDFAADGRRRLADRRAAGAGHAAPSSPSSTWSRPISASPTRWAPRPRLTRADRAALDRGRAPGGPGIPACPGAARAVSRLRMEQADGGAASGCRAGGRRSAHPFRLPRPQRQVGRRRDLHAQARSDPGRGRRIRLRQVGDQPQHHAAAGRARPHRRRLDPVPRPRRAASTTSPGSTRRRCGGSAAGRSR